MWASPSTELIIILSTLCITPFILVLLSVLIVVVTPPDFIKSKNTSAANMSTPAQTAKTRHGATHPITPFNTPASKEGGTSPHTASQAYEEHARGAGKSGAHPAHHAAGAAEEPRTPKSSAMEIEIKGPEKAASGEHREGEAHEKAERAFVTEPRQSVDSSRMMPARSHVGYIPTSPEKEHERRGGPSPTAEHAAVTAPAASQAQAKPATSGAVLAATVPSTEAIVVSGPSGLPPYSTADAFFATLARIKAETFAIEGIPSQKPIWVCNRDDKVTDVIHGLILRKVHAVPVLYRTTGRYMGFLDWMDVLHYVLNHFGRTKFEVERSFWDLVEEEKEFSGKTVNDLIQHHGPGALRLAFHPLDSGYSAFSVMEAMARERSLHRVPILSNSVDRQLINLVTQSQCVRWIAAHRHLLGDKLRKPIPSCSRFFKTVFSVTEDSVAIDAFQLMADRHVHGVAIVDSTGKLRGNISVRDLKVIGADASLFWRLTQTVKNFMRKVHTDYRMAQGRPRSVVYVVPEDSKGIASTLEDVLSTLVENDIHRVYLCDTMTTRLPIGVVSLRDILYECLA